MTNCKQCRALDIRKGFTRGYVRVDNHYSCALGHKVDIADSKPVCGDTESCRDKTIRRKDENNLCM